MVQPLCRQLDAGAVAHVLLDEVALVVPAVEAVDPDQAVILRLLLELTLTVDGPADEPARVAAGDDAAGDDLAGERVALADLLDRIEDLLVGRVDRPGLPAGLLDVLEELLGTAEGRILRGELLPHLDGRAFAVLDRHDRCVGVIAVSGRVALAAVGADDEIVLCQLDDLFHAALGVLDLLGDLLVLGAVADDVRDRGVEEHLSAVVGDVFAHREDHGLILVVAGETQRAQIRQTVDVVDVALQVELHLKGAVPLLEREHGLPVGPEVRGVELIVKHVIDLLVLEGLVGRHEQLEQLRGGARRQAVLAVGMGVLALLLGDAAQGEVRVFLVEVVVLGEDRLARVHDRRDGLEQIPHALEVVIHLTAAAHDEALGRIVDAVAGAAGYGQVLKERDVLTGHLCIADQKAGRCQTGQTGADDISRLALDAFGFFRRCKRLIVTAAVIHSVYLPFMMCFPYFLCSPSARFLLLLSLTLASKKKKLSFDNYQYSAFCRLYCTICYTNGRN